MWRRACVAFVLMTGCLEAVPEELRTFCEDAETKQCAYEVRCGLAVSESACRAALLRERTDLGDSCGLNRDATYARRMRFDDAAAQSCFAAWAGECTDVALTCAPFAGIQKEGGACFNHLECALDFYCEAHDACRGRCAPRKPVGAEAFTTRECEAGSTPLGNLVDYDGPQCGTLNSGNQPCDAFTPCATGFRCVGFECRLDDRRHLSDACGGVTHRFPDGGVLLEELPGCRDALACASFDDEQPSCNVRHGANGPCLDDTGCMTGLACINYVCLPLSLEQGLCWTNASCANPLICVDNTCVRPTRRIGDDCSMGRCAEGSCAYDPKRLTWTCRAWAELCNRPR